MSSGANNIPLGEVRRGGSSSLMAQRGGGGQSRGGGGGRGRSGPGRGGAGGGGGGGQRGRGGSRGRGAGRGRGRGGRGRGGSRPQRRGSPSTTKSEMEKRRKTQILEEVKKQFGELNLEFGDPHMDPKRDPGKDGEQIVVKTNIFGIKMNEERSFQRYDVTISAMLKKKKGPKDPSSVELTKRTKDDSVVVERRKHCAAAFDCFFQKYPDVFGTNRAKLIYDMQCILFTDAKTPLQFGEHGNPDNSEGTLKMGLEDFANVEVLKDFKFIKMLLKKVNKIVEMSSLSLLNNDMTQQNHTLPQFLELAVTQEPLNQPDEHVILGHSSYLLHPENYGFCSNDGPILSKDNKYLGIGIHKGVRYVEGPAGRVGNCKRVGLVVESKKTPFHNIDANLIYKALSIVGQNNMRDDGAIRQNCIAGLNQQFKNLFVECRYPNKNRRVIQLSGISKHTAHEYSIEIKPPKNAPKGERPRRLTVENYFLERYEQRLEFPMAPLATTYENGQTNYYPMEILWPVDNQRAQLSQLSARETAAMIRAAAVPPDQLKHQIECSLTALNVKESAYLKEADIKVVSQLKANARQLPPPIILGRDDKESGVDKSTCKFQIRDSFFLPATIEKWAFYLIRSGGRGDLKFEEPEKEKFIKAFMNTCRGYGMTLNNPDDMGELDPVEGHILKQFKLMCDEQCDFVFFITSDGVTNMHDVIKRGEREFHVVSQDLKLSNAVEIVNRGKQETLQNIVYKTNEKMGGINYSIKIRDQSIQDLAEETLFIGLGTSHAGAMGNYERVRGAAPIMPSVIGYAANMKKNAFDFVGDFTYDEPRRDEKYSTMSRITEACVKRFDEARGCVPKRLILFRNGQAEGQYANSLQYEIPLVRHALENCGAKDCKLTVLATQKMHSIRLFAEPMDPENSAQSGRRVNLNIKPGTVVDEQLTHPEHNEFYLNSHTAIQGTTRAPRYTTLYDENEFSADQIQQMVYALAYGHKIITSPTSLPAPIYIAMMYAKRGRALYKVMRDDPFLNDLRHENGQMDYEELTKALGYNTAEFLRDKRVNA